MRVWDDADLGRGRGPGELGDPLGTAGLVVGRSGGRMGGLSHGAVRREGKNGEGAAGGGDSARLKRALVGVGGRSV